MKAGKYEMIHYKIQRVQSGEALIHAFSQAIAAGDEGGSLGSVAQYPWGCDYRPVVRFMIGWNDAATYVVMRCYEESPRITVSEENGAVYRDSCMEFFVSLGEGAGYENFEMNAAGVLLLHHGPDPDTRFEAVRDDTELAGTGSARLVQAQRGQDAGGAWWQLLLTVPHVTLARLSYGYPVFSPVPGTTIRANLYKCGDDTQGPHYGCCFPIDAGCVPAPNFHVSAYFGTLEYV